MINKRARYIYHLDNLRLNKNFTVKQLCDGICSDRQYRKYLSGDNNISDQRLMDFCDNLGISARDFYYSLNEKDVYVLKHIKNLYYALTKKKYNKVSSLLENTHNIDLMTNQNRRFFNYCLIRFYYETKKYDEKHAISEASKYVDYPKCKDNNVFDFVDILFLLFIAQIEIHVGIQQGLKILLKILSNKNFLYLSSENRSILPPVYSTVSIMLGKLKLYDQCIEITDSGIDFCIKNSFNKSLTRLYYSKAVAHKMLDNLDLAKHYAVLCFTNVISRNNKSEIKLFYKTLMQDFDIDPFVLIQLQKEAFLK
ncbi:helix-turn-helix transcriptional regulator [Haloplasma contractile]|uniref:Cro/C1-type HTH domain protein n=1 Tax=Haloplasma contractile SSD-17B TaxID=1033810 RepID=F7Q0L2_9MOLU|nr:helix-turn-helix transcriptional regulator [Haloplasma contractile]ERJ12643.1 Cro/C1-type HTH domain protein [Haloplasma contractile SSD-17B]